MFNFVPYRSELTMIIQFGCLYFFQNTVICYKDNQHFSCSYINTSVQNHECTLRANTFHTCTNVGVSFAFKPNMPRVDVQLWIMVPMTVANNQLTHISETLSSGTPLFLTECKKEILRETYCKYRKSHWSIVAFYQCCQRSRKAHLAGNQYT